MDELRKLLEPILAPFAERVAERAVEKLLPELREKPPKILLTPDEFCAACSIGRSKLDELVEKGLPQVFLGKKTPRYRLADCEAWLLANPHLLAEDASDG